MAKTTCDIKRNGRLYDSLNPDTHAVQQIFRSYAHDMPDDFWELFKIDGSLWMTAQKEKTEPKRQH